MDKLTLEHLAPYFPYGLKVIAADHSGNPMELYGYKYDDTIRFTCKMSDTDTGYICLYLPPDKFKPILRPLSDLTKEIEHNGESFVPSKVLSAWDLQGICVGSVIHAPYNLFEIFIKWHFDVFGLIAAGLAVDINTLEGGSSNGN